MRFEAWNQGKNRMPEVMKTLFLNPPSYEGFDGGAGARYQARREIKSFWYPTWLAQHAVVSERCEVCRAPQGSKSQNHDRHGWRARRRPAAAIHERRTGGGLGF